MYEDYYPSSSSSFSSATTTAHHRFSRQLHNAYRQQRASKATDIAYLLDPSYSPSRSFASGSNNGIYIDHAGEMHDPDFRFFAPANYSPKRREFLTSLPEPGYGNDDDDDDEVEDEGIAMYATGARRESFDSYRPTSRASDPSPSLLYSYNRDDAVGYENNTYTYSPSYDDEGYASEEEPRRESNKLRRRRDAHANANAMIPLDATPSQPRPTSPTTAHPFRRQWHAIRLRAQVTAFRAKRRMSQLIRPLCASNSNTG